MSPNFIGLMIVLFLSFISQAANLKAVSWLLKLVRYLGDCLSNIIQPEIRGC
ncbi:MAG: hypothetical protein IPJ03_15360 [Ignavibacteriales bacterium]|nr:hypothetical protein [Ignavibacteriales bacterium]